MKWGASHGIIETVIIREWKKFVLPLNIFGKSSTEVKND
jgi:hypothetical protein